MNLRVLCEKFREQLIEYQHLKKDLAELFMMASWAISLGKIVVPLTKGMWRKKEARNK
jgi:hypothetical protein